MFIVCEITVISKRCWYRIVFVCILTTTILYSARLYKSPEQSVKNSILQNSSYDWLRTDFDRPSPELSSARRSLVVKLDQVTKRKSIFLYLCYYMCSSCSK